MAALEEAVRNSSSKSAERCAIALLGLNSLPLERLISFKLHWQKYECGDLVPLIDLEFSNGTSKKLT